MLELLESLRAMTVQISTEDGLLKFEPIYNVNIMKIRIRDSTEEALMLDLRELILILLEQHCDPDVENK